MTINELFIILTLKQPSKFLMSKEEDLFKLIPELKYCKGFDQKNEWHPYDVYTHILKVVDGVDCNLPTRLAALFHDIGKPQTFKLDENGVGHFYGHWEVSKNIFRDFAIKHEEIGDNLKELVEQLIEFHDKDFGKLNDEGLKQFVNDFSEEEMFMLYDLKEADLKAQNEKFRGKLDEYNRQKVKFFTYYDEAKKLKLDDIKKIIIGTTNDIRVGGNIVNVGFYNSSRFPSYIRLLPNPTTHNKYEQERLRLLYLRDQLEDYEDKVVELENKFIKAYYENNLEHIGINQLMDKLKYRYGEGIILCSSDELNKLPVRRIIADYLELNTGIYIPEIALDNDNIKKVNITRYKQRIRKIIKK